MAFIEKTAFEAKVSNHEFDSVANITGKFYGGAAYEACSAGFLCTKDELLSCEGYATAKNGNTWKMIAATAEIAAAEPIYACDPHDVNTVVDPVTGAEYKVGANTLGIPLPKDRFGTFKQVKFDGAHIYRFGIGNVSTAISSNKFFTIADGKLVPASAAPVEGGKPYFKLLNKGAFTEGSYNAFEYVDVMACTSVAGA